MIRAVALLFVLVLGACGFQPVYGTGGTAFSGAVQVKVEPIRGRSGYVLRRALLQELSAGLPDLAGPATLRVELEDKLTRLAFQPDGAASRAAVVAKAEYTLSGEDFETGGVADVEAGFIVPDAPFGDIAAQTSASDRAMRQLAKEIADDLRLKLAAG